MCCSNSCCFDKRTCDDCLILACELEVDNECRCDGRGGRGCLSKGVGFIKVSSCERVCEGKLTSVCETVTCESVKHLSVTEQIASAMSASAMSLKFEETSTGVSGALHSVGVVCTDTQSGDVLASPLCDKSLVMDELEVRLTSIFRADGKTRMVRLELPSASSAVEVEDEEANGLHGSP